MHSEQLAQQIVDSVTERLRTRSRIPRATYRLQLHAEFTLRDALVVVPYLHQLGVSHLYVSSIVTAKPGSRHGYDVVDHTQLNPELGDANDLAALADELHRRDMGLLLDIVANHMHVGPENAWWNDVLENGPASPYAEYFDIAWQDVQRERLRGKVLLPILDEPYGRALENGKFRPMFQRGEAFLLVNDSRLPLDPRTYGAILAPALEAAKSTIGPEDPGVLELQSILAAVKHLPPRDEAESERVREGLAEIAVIKRRLRELSAKFPAVTECLRSTVTDLSGHADDPASFTPLAELLDAQAYRPCFWRVAQDEINYRRFFDVNDLAALSTEREEVFQAIHALPLEWLKAGIVDGFRIDHIDGLRDPDEYLRRLQRYSLVAYAQQEYESRGATEIPWDELQPLIAQKFAEREAECPRIYVVVEKILGPAERLPANWVCDGTTGYDCLNEINGLFVDAGQLETLDGVYRRFTGNNTPFVQLAHDAKIQVMQSMMASELYMLALKIDRLAQSHWYTQDFTLNSLRHALREIVACFSVYRSYIAEEAQPPDRTLVLRAARQARVNNPLLGRQVFQFIADTLLLKDPHPGGASDDYRQMQREIAGKFQQLTAPVTAKGVEDTALYRYHRLISLNEVGGEPDHFGRSPRQLHEFLQERTESQPGALTPLSTHDTKRNEDVRARINVLSECPEEWGRRIARWYRLNRQHRTILEDGTDIPDANEEYLLYQTLIGSWPTDPSQADDAYIQRIQAYMTKAVREAKLHSSWINPDLEYDAAVAKFAAGILDPIASAEFLADFHEFHARIHQAGSLNSLAQTVLRCAVPGVPDTYQGSEFFDDSLVDPDNRRPVDYAARNDALHGWKWSDVGIPPAVSRELGSREFWNRTKQFLINRCLQLRAEQPTLFEHGDYRPLTVTGTHAEHVFALLRTLDRSAVLVIVPRLMLSHDVHALEAQVSLPSEWQRYVWKNVLTNQTIKLSNDDPVPVITWWNDFPVGVWTT